MAKASNTDAPKKWRLTYEGEVYDERALTLGEAELIEDFLGVSWLQINPVRSAKQARGVLAVLHAERTGRSRDETYAALGSMRAEEWIVDCISYVDDDMPGSYSDGFPTTAAAERSTGTSSDSTGALGGGRRRSPAKKRSGTST